MKTKTILLLLFSLLIAIIAIQNAQAIEVSFLFWQFSASQIFVILGSFGIGLIVGWILSFLNKRKVDQ